METVISGLISKPAMLIYGGIITLLVFVLKAKFSENQEAEKEYREADKKLFQEVFNICSPDSPAINLIRGFDFCGNFHMNAAQPLEALTILWTRTDKTFHEDELESKRLALDDAVNEFIHKLGMLSSPADAGEGMLNCLLTIERDDFAEISDKTQADLKELDMLAKNTYDRYKDFLETGRRHLRLGSVS